MTAVYNLNRSDVKCTDILQVTHSKRHLPSHFVYSGTIAISKYRTTKYSLFLQILDVLVLDDDVRFIVEILRKSVGHLARVLYLLLLLLYSWLLTFVFSPYKLWI